LEGRCVWKYLGYHLSVEAFMLDLRAHKHKRGVNCVGKFLAVSGNRRRPCSDRGFVTLPEPKL